jgi:hypothetical protein
MVLQKSYYDGTTGYSFNMQTGKTALTADELESKKKSSGLIPEMGYVKNGMDFELVGIENVDGKDFYVIKTTDKSGESYDYYNTTTFFKEKTTSIRKQGEEVTETSSTLSDYKDVSGILFPHTISLTVGKMSLSGKVSQMTINGKVDLKDFK